MLRSCRNKKWTKLAAIVVLLISSFLPLVNGANSVYADAQVTVLNCYEFINSNGGSTITDSQGREVSTDELRKACETDRDKNLENVEVNGKNVCKGLKSWGSMAWSACVDEVNNSGGNAAETVVVAIDNPTINPDEPGANNNSGNGPGSNASGTTDTTGSTDDARDCMNSGAAATLGWIVCPVLNWLTGAANTIYETFLEPALQVAPQLFTNGGSTYQGWEFFRNLANGLMIILLLFVIFSQVTGVGIDNYGIKKTLPKIIVAAILMNLSYWICIAAVDLSNIIGNGLQQMFIGLAEGITIPPIEIGEGVTAAIQTGTLSTAVTILVAIAGASGAIWALKNNLGGIALLIAVSAISVLVSILTLFIILAARQAAIVVLVVISPLAMACYMLPNTQNLFKKWLKFLQTLLLVYPIAGLLVGGGNYVSTLLLGTGMANNLFGAVTAMITGIIPIFFIPSVLRRSLAFAGDIGNKISGVGRNIGRRTSGAVDRGVKNTEAWKRSQDYRANQRKVASARRVDAKMRNRINSGRTLTAKQQDTMAQAQKVLSAQRSRTNDNRNLSDIAYLRNERRKQDIQNNNAREDVMLYANAEMVDGSLNKAANQRRQQLADARDWSNIAHVAAMENKQDTQHDIAEAELMLHLNPTVNQSELNKANEQIQRKLDEATNWTDNTYVLSQRAKARTESEEERANTSTWVTDPNKVASVRAQGEISRLNQQGQNANWADTTYQESQRRKTISTNNEERLNTSEWVNDPNKVAAVQAQGQTTRENQQLQSQNWANGTYVQGVRERQRLQSTDDLGKTTMYANAGFAEGAAKQQQLQRSETFKNTARYAGTSGDALVAAETTKGDNSRLMSQEEANAKVPVLSQAVAAQRAISRKETTEFKDYSDQYSTLSRGDMAAQLHAAIDQYQSGGRRPEDTVRLQAAISAASSRGMSKELLAELGDVDFTANSASDTKILSQMASSNNTLLSQYAKSRSKPANAAADTAAGLANGKSLNSFINEADYSAASASGDNLASVFKNKGDDIAKGMDDDTYEYLNNKGGAKALSTKAIYNAIGATTNTKELNQLHAMAAGRTDYQMSVNELGRIKLSTLNALGANNSSYMPALNELKKNMATSSAYQQIYANMDPAVKKRLGI